MSTKTLGFLLFALFTVFSLTNAWEDELFDANEYDTSSVQDEFDTSSVQDEFDTSSVQDEFDTASALDESFDKFAKSEVNKEQCRQISDHYTGERCIKSQCLSVCKKDGFTNAKCRKSNKDKVKKCFCYKKCGKSPSPKISPPVSPVPSASPVSPPSTPTNPPAVSPVPEASPVNPPSIPSPAPSSDDPPCDDDDATPTSPVKPKNDFEKFSNEENEFIFS